MIKFIIVWMMLLGNNPTIQVNLNSEDKYNTIEDCNHALEKIMNHVKFQPDPEGHTISVLACEQKEYL